MNFCNLDWLYAFQGFFFIILPKTHLTLAMQSIPRLTPDTVIYFVPILNAYHLQLVQILQLKEMNKKVIKKLFIT